jgi:hypothetical protein
MKGVGEISLIVKKGLYLTERLDQVQGAKISDTLGSDLKAKSGFKSNAS